MYRRNLELVSHQPLEAEEVFSDIVIYYLFVSTELPNGYPIMYMGGSLEAMRAKVIELNLKGEGVGYFIQANREVVEYSFPEAHIIPFPQQQQLRRVANPRDPMDMGYQVGGGAMVKSQLASIEREARTLHDILVRGDRLPQWVHSKVSTALDRLQSASTYLRTKVPMMQEMRQNPLFGSQSSYIRNSPQMCTQAYISSILMSHPMTREYAVASAERDGFDPIVAGIAFDNLVELGEISHVGDGKYLDTDFVS